MTGHHRGRDFRPIRLAPSHQWAREVGAVFVESGAWLRAQHYPRAGEKDWLETVNREVTATRASIGVCDVSTLGKIEIEGADAAIFLDRVYTNTFSTLPVGKSRYGLMLREDGFAMDDGTTSRLAPERYVMTTTTAQAGRVMQHLEFCHQVPGTEALGTMRIEKGHVAGNEINGQLTARDLGLGRMMSTRKDYIGRVMAQRPALTDPDRPALVGFRPVDRKARLRAGAHFIPVGTAATAENDEGYMTSVAFSPMLGSWIGLGVLKRGPQRAGGTVRAY